MSTHGARIDYGKHRGELFTRLPISYLKWMIRENAPLSEIASEELDRRGSKAPDLEVSGHALDRFSLRHLEKWTEGRSKGEGLWSYVNRAALLAWQARSHDSEADTTKVHRNGVTWVFALGGAWPTVKTVL